MSQTEQSPEVKAVIVELGQIAAQRRQMKQDDVALAVRQDELMVIGRELGATTNALGAAIGRTGSAVSQRTPSQKRRW